MTAPNNEHSPLPTVQERETKDLFILTFELCGRSSTQWDNPKMHEAYYEARTELESRYDRLTTENANLKQEVERLERENSTLKLSILAANSTIEDMQQRISVIPSATNEARIYCTCLKNGQTNPYCDNNCVFPPIPNNNQ